jgi:TRAP-type C4-dicarboxylate transport system permease small subunit
MTDEADEYPGFDGTLPLPSVLVQGLRLLVATCAFLMMALIFVDVLARYTLNSPLGGAFEILQMLLAMLVFLSLPLVVWADANISVGLFVGWFKGGSAFALKTCVMLTSIAALTLLASMLWRQFGSLQQSQQETGYLQLPIYPLALLMTALVVLSAVIQAAMLWHHLRNRGAK